MILLTIPPHAPLSLYTAFPHRSSRAKTERNPVADREGA